MENYIVINGKKAELTEEQLEKLGIKTEKKKYKEMFELSNDREPYFFIKETGEIVCCPDSNLWQDINNARYACGNVCKDKEIMKQRALHETLDRLLWRASVIAGELDNPWYGLSDHYYIFFNTNTESFDVNFSVGWSVQGICYFPTKESAEDAIENIIKPFMKEHPDFKW